MQKCGYDSYTSVLYSREIIDRIDKDKNEKTLFIGRKKYVDLPDYGFVFIPETEYVFSGVPTSMPDLPLTTMMAAPAALTASSTSPTKSK